MRRRGFILLVGLLLGACSPANSTPAQDDIQTAIAQTEEAKPTNTSTLAWTNTPVPTNTPTPEPTFTPSPTPDLRVIDADPYTFLLTKDDLPKDARYYLPNEGWISPHRNSEIISGWGVDEGRDYLAATGRVDGWWVYYDRGTQTVIAPEEVYDNVVMYRDATGAALIMEKYSTCADPDSDYANVTFDFKIGDITRACTWREMQSNGENRVWYRIEFTYRNYYHAVGGWGWEDEVTLEYVAGIAQTLFEKLEQAPLSESVTFKP